MPEADTTMKAEKEFHANIPQESHAFFLKGSNAHDWGMNNRLARIFNPRSGRP
jgi:putative autoinducer-2 (AI-2) aldolase